MVFQQFNLFPHLTVMDNVTLAARRIKKQRRAAAEAKGLELLDAGRAPREGAANTRISCRAGSSSASRSRAR